MITLEECRDLARRRWGSLTPFRLGVMAGANGLKSAAPYTKTKSLRNYRDGLQFGGDHRAEFCIEDKDNG